MKYFDMKLLCYILSGDSKVQGREMCQTEKIGGFFWGKDTGNFNGESGQWIKLQKIDMECRKNIKSKYFLKYFGIKTSKIKIINNFFCGKKKLKNIFF